jgi:ABC-type lipoprotein export system ATPase subunit
MIELRNVTKTYGEPGTPGCVEVLKGISLTITPAQSMAIVGPSGSGKSTLLNIMGALDQPTSGQVLWEGKDLASLGEKGRAEFRNRQVGFVFQLHHLLPQCTALENVLVPTLAKKAGGSQEANLHRAKDLLAKVGLADQMSRRPGELSGGQRQRVAVARALINEPKLLLADEPTGSLDERAADGIADLLKELNFTQGLALVVVTHAARIAARFGRAAAIHDGLLREEMQR